MSNEKKMELLAEILDVDVEFTRLIGKEIKGSEIKQFVTVQDALNVMEE